MKTWITLCLSLVLCSVHVIGALVTPGLSPSEEMGSCCKPSKGTHCPATCCVDRNTPTPSESSAPGLPVQTSRVSVDTPALLTVAWVLAAPLPALLPDTVDLASAITDIAMPLFLRHGAILI